MYKRQELRQKKAGPPQKDGPAHPDTFRSLLKNSRQSRAPHPRRSAQCCLLYTSSPVSQGGRNLSGGQRQRLTIARALVRSPEILILDDSASALDFATDARLRRAIRELPGGMTVFIVSQRAASVRHADRIVVLDDGQIVGLGDHDTLLRSCPVYQEIYYSQFPKEVDEK